MNGTQAVTLANGITLDVWQQGADDAPPLMFLHGFPESHRAWRHQIAALAGRYRCIAPDQRGYGRSSRPDAVQDYATEHLAGDVFALADALGIDRFGLLGHDWGGIVAWMALQADKRRRITHAVIANAPHPHLFQHRLFLDADQRAASQYIREFRNTDHDAEIAAQGLAPILLREFGTGAFANMEPDEREALLARWREPGAAQAMLAWYRASPILVPPPDAPMAVPDGWLPGPKRRVRAPVLVIWGEDDPALPPANLDGLKSTCMNVSVARLPGVGHFCPWEAPVAVNAAIAVFLARLV